MARRRFFVDSLRAGLAELTGEDARHLVRVLRTEPGQRFEISDNRRPYLAEVAEIGRERVVFRVLEPVEPREQPLEAVLYAALVKFDRFEWIVEKATELGAASIVPFEAERSENGLARAAVKRVERWRRIARESSQQSRRDRMPEVAAPAALEACLADAAALRLFLDEDPLARPLVSALPGPDGRLPGARVALIAGPEGGWTAAERARAIQAGWTPVSLGPGILRAETAVLAGLSVLMSAWWAAVSG
jgi:16S rRNA (uracil1498-N3)-methyltransferase